jgi:L-alanine-DL-glutamate epimerase-like enolase superfamily enzyme
LVTEPLAIGDGVVQLPLRPGLGVEVDERAVERFRVR